MGIRGCCTCTTPDMRVKIWPKLVAAYCIKAKYGYTLKAGETEAGPSRTRERGRTSESGLARPWWRRSGQEELPALLLARQREGAPSLRGTRPWRRQGAQAAPARPCTSVRALAAAWHTCRGRPPLPGRRRPPLPSWPSDSPAVCRAHQLGQD
jgi:hypothetical protein